MQKYLTNAYFSRSLFAIWLLSALLIFGATLSNVASWRMGDADDYLRLVQVRDLIAGQGWWDVTQYRMNMPDGGPVHWSRLVDIPLALVVILLTPLLGQTLAEQSAITLVPLATYAIFLFLIGHAARRIFDEKVALLTAASCFALLPVINQFVPARIDHHGWQLVAFAACLYALLDPEKRARAGIIIGAALAVWMEISVEALPYVAIFMGLLCLRWLSEKNSENGWHQFPAAMASLAATSIILLLAMEGPNFALNYCDSFSLFHMLAFTVAAIAVVAGGYIAPHFSGRPQLIAKLVFCGLAGIAGIAAILLSAPQCAGDAFGNLDPLVRQYWYNFVPEGMPLWEIHPEFAAQPFAGLVISVVAATWFVTKSNALSSFGRFEIFFLFAATAIVGAFVQRASAYAIIIGLIFASALAIKLFIASDTKSFILPRLSMKLLAVLFLIPTVIGQHGYSSLRPILAKTSDQRGVSENNLDSYVKICHSAETVEMLNRLPRSNLMVGLDVSPSILMLTKHNVIATGHHRNQTAMKDVILTFTSHPDKARAIMAKRNIDYLLTCPGSFELYRYSVNAPDGLVSRLRRGDAPPWLKPQKPMGPYQIWRFDGGAFGNENAL